MQRQVMLGNKPTKNDNEPEGNSQPKAEQSQERSRRHQAASMKRAARPTGREYLEQDQPTEQPRQHGKKHRVVGGVKIEPSAEQAQRAEEPQAKEHAAIDDPGTTGETDDQ